MLSSMLLSSCGSAPEPSRATHHLNMMDDSLIRYNKSVVNQENQQIEDFIARYRWEMKKTSTGLRYMISKQGNGAAPSKDSRVVILYTVRLLNGNLCYSTGHDHPREFRIGHSSAESGLEEGILLMREGAQAKFIVPSHLAFGLLGDQDKIPQRATLIYDVELIKVK